MLAQKANSENARRDLFNNYVANDLVCGSYVNNVEGFLDKFDNVVISAEGEIKHKLGSDMFKNFLENELQNELR